MSFRIDARNRKLPEASASRHLSRAEFFRGLPPSACARLARLSRERSIQKRETLFIEGARGRHIFFLVEGGIVLHKTSPDGTEIVIRTVRPGETFAEVILFEQDRYPVTATALLRSRVLEFARTDFLDLLEERRFRNDFIASLMQKQRYLAERVRYLTACDVEQRLFLYLKEQFGEFSSVSLALSKKDVAAAIGATPETLSRLLQRLRREGTLQWSGRTLSVRTGFWNTFDTA